MRVALDQTILSRGPLGGNPFRGLEETGLEPVRCGV